MATSFDTSDTVQMKGTVTGVTRLSKQAKGFMALGGGLLMCLILFAIFTMGDDGASPPTPGDVGPATEAKPQVRNEPASAGDLLKNVSDGQAAPSPRSVSPLDPNSPNALGPGFSSLPSPEAAAAGGHPARPPNSRQRPAPLTAGQGDDRSSSGAIIVPAPDGTSTAVAIGSPRQPTREERAALARDDERAQLAKRAREGGMELDGGSWTAESQRTGGASPLAGLPGDGASPFGAAATAGANLPRAMQAAQGGQDDPNKQQRKEQFLREAQAAQSSAYLKQTVATLLSKYEIKAGWQIPVALEGGINTDLPGQVRARVRENVYDTAEGNYLLIPQGTLAIGSYDSQIAVGQSRILVAWQRLIFPDGTSMMLEGMPGADQAGNAGLTGDVNNHYTRIFGSALLMSMISAGVQLSQPQTSTGNGQAPTSGQVIAGAVGQQLGQVSTAMIQRQMQVQPTITQEPGYRFVIQVTKDILFPSAYRP